MVGSVEDLKKLLQQSRVVTFLGGAGVSTESGIPDFRSKGSAEAAQKRFGYPPEVLLSHDFFLAHPDIFYDYYKSVLLVPASPNPAHYALARLEAAGKLNAVITQNIDSLHQQAGSKRVYPVHGNVEWNRCMECNRFFNGDYIRNSQGVPHCDQCGGLIKPEVVLYGAPGSADLAGGHGGGEQRGYHDRRRHLPVRISGGLPAGVFHGEASDPDQQDGDPLRPAGGSDFTPAHRPGAGGSRAPIGDQYSSMVKQGRRGPASRMGTMAGSSAWAWPSATSWAMVL